MNKEHTVYVIDDSPTILNIISQHLKEFYNLKLFKSSKQFLDLITNDNLSPPDLILLDVEMPEYSGYEVLIELKKNDKFKDVPVIFLTAKCGEDFEKEGLELGAVDYITKPYSPSVLLSRIKNHIFIKQSKDLLRIKNEELKTLKDQYQELYDTAPVGYLTININGDILVYNKTFLDLLKLKKDLLPQNIKDLILPQDLILFNNFLNNLNIHKSESSIEIRLKKNQKFIWSLLSAKYHENNIRLTISDITQLKEYYRQYLTYLDIIERAPISIIITNKDNKIIYTNSFYSELTGYHKMEVIGKDPGFIKSGKTPKETYQSLWNTLNQKKTWNGIFINKKKNGELFTEESLIKPILDEDNEIIYYIAIKIDITEKLELIEKNQSLMRAKSLISLSSGIAHHLNNINTPLLIISDLLSAKLSNQPEYKKMFDLMTNSIKRATDLINSIKIYSKNYIIKPKFTSINKIVNSLVEQYKNNNTNIKFDNKLLDPPEFFLHIDEDLIQLAISNLIQNAIEAINDYGTITISANFKHEKKSNNMKRYLVLTIKDNGIGIPDDIREHIFEPFFTTKQHRNALGLGLSEVSSIIEQHNGYIEVISKVNEGTQFNIFLPADITTEQ